MTNETEIDPLHLESPDPQGGPQGIQLKKNSEMARNELRKTIEAALPKGWRLDTLSMRRRMFIATCPVEDRFDVPVETFLGKTREIEKATNAAYDGGGGTVGGDAYECFFYFND